MVIKISAIVFSKPIIDEKLNLLAVVNFEFNFNQILNKLNSNSELIFEKFVSNSSDIEKDRLFILIPIFKLEDSKTFYLKSNLLEKNIKIEKLNDFYNFLTIFFGLSLALLFFCFINQKIKILKINF